MVQAEVFHYELVDEHDLPIGALAHESNDLDVGDIVPCDGHMFEIRAVDEATLHVRRVI
jgi:lysyl-tRNA synthetase class II